MGAICAAADALRDVHDSQAPSKQKPGDQWQDISAKKTSAQRSCAW
jgi:hypothetical protein